MFILFIHSFSRHRYSVRAREHTVVCDHLCGAQLFSAMQSILVCFVLFCAWTETIYAATPAIINRVDDDVTQSIDFANLGNLLMNSLEYSIGTDIDANEVVPLLYGVDPDIAADINLTTVRTFSCSRAIHFLSNYLCLAPIGSEIRIQLRDPPRNHGRWLHFGVTSH